MVDCGNGRVFIELCLSCASFMWDLFEIDTLFYAMAVEFFKQIIILDAKWVAGRILPMTAAILSVGEQTISVFCCHMQQMFSICRFLHAFCLPYDGIVCFHTVHTVHSLSSSSVAIITWISECVRTFHFIWF